ncbi:MAG: glycosyltransferase [Leptolyngbyaceae cyanobacterium bins.349]|nr:glycosyltransferase [Leptolyngbyaceae cyanobacterium bins.349]
MHWLPKKLARFGLGRLGSSDRDRQYLSLETLDPISSDPFPWQTLPQPQPPAFASYPSTKSDEWMPCPYRASIILPIYNEQACIHSTFDAVLAYAKTHPTYDFIFVNDGSTDRTVALLEAQIAASNSDRILLISYSQRGGKGYAVRRGIEVADGDYICFLDGDLAYSLEHLDLMLSKLEWFEMVIGCRSLVIDGNQGIPPVRKLAGKIFNTLSRRILNLQYVDMQAGLKGFQKEAAKRLFSLQELTGFSFDVELIYLARKQGYTIAEIPAHVSYTHSRKQSKVNLLLDSLKMLNDLLRIRLNDWLGRYE